MSNGNSKSSAVADEFAQDMELDEQPRDGPAANGTKASTSGSGRNPEYDTLLTKAMVYGQELQRDYRDSPDGEQGKTLLDIFSLVAYDNPRQSVHGSLLDKKGRVAVAEELNSAILGKIWYPTTSTSTNVYSLARSFTRCRSGEDVPSDRSSCRRSQQRGRSSSLCQSTVHSIVMTALPFWRIRIELDDLQSADPGWCQRLHSGV
jgi:CTLH/CRA C-terminal to LisH motif domain